MKNKELTEQEKYEQYLEGARVKLEEAALAFARMKTTGTYTENGVICRVCSFDKEDYAKMYAQRLQNAAMDLLIEMQNAPLPPRKKD